MNGFYIVGGLAAVAAVVLLARKNMVPEENQPPQRPQDQRTTAGPIYSSRLLDRQQIRMADLIVSRSQGAELNPQFMLALAVTESSLNPRAIGDDGFSVGLFQLHKKFITATQEELLDAEFNTEAAIQKMALLIRSFPGHSYGDYAEAWTLGGAGRFRKMRRNPVKWTTMQRAIDDLGLDLFLTENP